MIDVQKESVSVHRDVLAALLDAYRFAESHHGQCLVTYSLPRPFYLDTVKAALPELVKKLDEVA